MSDELFKGRTTKERVQEGNKLVSKFPQLNSYFGEQWLNSLLQSQIEVENIHPMFWYLTNSLVNERFAYALTRLANESNACKKFISELKSAKTWASFISSVREVETYHILREKGYSVQWKPGSKGVKSPDLLINESIPIYLEILTIVDSEADTKEQETHRMVQVGINKMDENPFAISTHYRQIVSIQDVDQILNFIKTELPLIRIQSGETERRSLKREDKIIVDIDFHYIEGIHGWCGGGGPARNIDDAGRIKKKILDKIQGFQFPKKGDDNHTNGYLIYLESMLSDAHSVAAAVMGQETISFSLPAPAASADSREPMFGRDKNGAIHHQSWDKTIAENLDFVASTKEHNGEILGKQSLLLVNENSRLDYDKLRGLLFTK